jgi:hypothetical protein
MNETIYVTPADALPQLDPAVNDLCDAGAHARALATHLRECWPSPSRAKPPAGPPILSTYGTLCRHVVRLATFIYRSKQPNVTAGEAAYQHWFETWMPKLRDQIPDALTRIDWAVCQLVDLFGPSLREAVRTVDGRHKIVLHTTAPLPWRPPAGRPMPRINPDIIEALEWAASKLTRLPADAPSMVADQLANKVPDPGSAGTVEKPSLGIALLVAAQRKRERLTVIKLAEALGEKRAALYENSEYEPLRDMANKLFGLFEKKKSRAEWDGPRQGDI